MMSKPQNDYFFQDDPWSVILSWEVLRVIYNVFLLVVILTAAWGDFTKAVYWREMLWFAAWLNEAYCMGPVGEMLLVLAGVHRQNARWWLFSTGSFLAIMLLIGHAIFYDKSFPESF